MMLPRDAGEVAPSYIINPHNILKSSHFSGNVF
jgi:hypothetical protein